MLSDPLSERQGCLHPIFHVEGGGKRTYQISQLLKEKRGCWEQRGRGTRRKKRVLRRERVGEGLAMNLSGDARKEEENTDM